MSPKNILFSRMFGPLAWATLAASASAQSAVFSDQTAAAHLTAVHTVQSSQYEIGLMSGGVAVGDFNRDGWQDVFVLGGPSAPDKLYINNHDGTFTDRAAEWGVARTHWGFGVAVGDFDNDGWPDIFVTSGGTDNTPGHHILYHNDGGHGFIDVAQQAGVQTTSTTIYDGLGAAWGDYDLDGYLDLAVAGWNYHSDGNKLFHNNGNGTFTDVTLALNANMHDVYGFSPRFVDMNGDRYPELLWVSDGGTSRYFVNNRDGTFTESTAAAGVGLDGNGMGCTVGDFNNDGLPDWYVTSITTNNHWNPFVPGTGNMLYLNGGAHHFTEVGAAWGVRQTGWGWGTVGVDLRNSGNLDIVATNGWQGQGWNGEFLADPTCVFLKSGAASYVNVAPACGVNHTGLGRGLLNFDYNNDGRQDILIATNGGPLTLYRNDTPGPNANYLRIFLNTRASHGLAPDGYGAHLIATFGGVQRHAWITGGSNYLSQSELSAHFGLADATTARVRVEWPNGTVTTRTFSTVNRTVTMSSCPADWNADGQLSVSDVFDFLNDWFAGGEDFDASGDASVQDIFAFLAAWFSGCP